MNKFLGYTGAVGAGCGLLALIVALIWGVIALISLALGLVEHAVFPQFGYWQEVGVTFLVLIALQMLTGKGGGSQ